MLSLDGLKSRVKLKQEAVATLPIFDAAHLKAGAFAARHTEQRGHVGQGRHRPPGLNC
jgi:hypothetical protein